MKEIRLSELLRVIAADRADLKGDPDKSVARAMPFDQADGSAVTFADNAGLLNRVPGSSAGAVIVPRHFSEATETNLIFSDQPRLSFARAMHYFYPRTPPFCGISSMAAIGDDFRCGEQTAIAPFAFVGDHVILGNRVVIHPHVYIGNGVHIGDDTEVMPNVTIAEKSRIGARVIIGANTVIGAEGFGFTPDSGRHFKIPQVGMVQIDDDVELGAGNTVDRATFGRTWIREGVKTDNQVHIAHNVTIGQHTIIVAQVGIAGSTQVGKNVILAGQAGIGGHISIGDGAVVGPQAGVARSVEAGKTVSGTPEMPHRQWLRVQQTISRLPEMKKQITALEKRLGRLEEDGRPTEDEDKDV